MHNYFKRRKDKNLYVPAAKAAGQLVILNY